MGITGNLVIRAPVIMPDMLDEYHEYKGDHCDSNSYILMFFDIFYDIVGCILSSNILSSIMLNRFFSIFVRSFESHSVTYGS